LADFDFDAALRWARKFDSGTLARRNPSELPMLLKYRAGKTFLFDTCVYIDSLQDKFSPEVGDIIDNCNHIHSVCALQEMMAGVGALNPADKRTKLAISKIGELIKTIIPQRLFQPDIDTAGRAALLAAALSRIQGYGKDNRSKALNDCTLFLQAQKMGTTLLTRNYADFDILLQMIPSGRVLFY
jgi:hypothetical protein